MPGRRTGQGRAAKAGSYEVTFARPVRARWTRRRGRQIRARAAEAPVRTWGQTEPGSPPGTVNARRLVVAGRRTDHPCQISDNRSRDASEPSPRLTRLRRCRPGDQRAPACQEQPSLLTERRRAGALVEDAATGSAREGAVARGSASAAPTRLTRAAARAHHRQSSPASWARRR